MKYEEITSCRLCGGPLSPFFSLGFQHLANDLLAEGQLSQGLFPIEIVSCDSCGLFQQKFSIDKDIIFNSNYAYETPDALIPHFKELASTVTNLLGLSEYDEIVEIGGNTSKSLECFKNIGFYNLTNIEPCANVAAKSVDKGIRTFNNFFSSDFAEEYIKFNKKPKLIFSCNVFSHSEAIGDMLDGIKIMLADDGIFIQENAYFFDTVLNLDFPTLYNEHVLFWSLSALEIACSQRSLQLFNVGYNSVQNGSFRTFIRHDKNQKVSKNIEIAKRKEDRLFKTNMIKSMFESIEFLGKQIKCYLEFYKHKKIAIYGVTAKVSVMLQYWGIQDYFSYAIDDSPLKQNKKIPGTNIPIYSRQKLQNEPPDIIFLGAYNMKDYILDKNKDFEGKWFCPLPDPKELN